MTMEKADTLSNTNADNLKKNSELMVHWGRILAPMVLGVLVWVRWVTILRRVNKTVQIRALKLLMLFAILASVAFGSMACACMSVYIGMY